MKMRKSLLLASLSIVGSISLSAIVPICLAEKSKMNSENMTTAGLLDWINE
jgi:tellurite resistance protein TehA-like permease